MAIQAIEDAKLIILPYEHLKKLFVEDHFWQQVGRIAAENEYIVAEGHNRFLRDKTASERYMDILDRQPDLLQRIPLVYLASYLQVSPETLSRIIKKISTT